MSVALSAYTLALAPGLQTQFLASGGTSPYTYSVVPGGAGGTINPSTGLYTAPVASYGVDTINVVGSLLGESASAQMKVSTYQQLFCDILQNQLALGDGRVYLWDQKVLQPKDNNLYIAVAVVACKPFANTNQMVPNMSGLQSLQSVNMQARLQVDMISRGLDALNRKEEVIMALNSNYAQQQQEINSFSIALLSSSFRNLSNQDGAAIPYRFQIDVNLLYAFTKVQQVPYFDTFEDPEVVTDA